MASLLSRPHPLLATAALLLAGTTSADTTWIDVRSDAERAERRVEGDAHVPFSDIAAGVQALGLPKDADIALYCAVGGRAGVAKLRLQSLGYSKVRNAGGIDDVIDARDCSDTGTPVVSCATERSR
ncbi:MAG: rhodanese-like domain-containing protein [Gammaproteobacteria bacterium]